MCLEQIECLTFGTVNATITTAVPVPVTLYIVRRVYFIKFLYLQLSLPTEVLLELPLEEVGKKPVNFVCLVMSALANIKLVDSIGEVVSTVIKCKSMIAIDRPGC